MKFYGKLGFGLTYEARPGVWTESYLEIDAYGDFIQNTYGLKSSNKVNDDINALYIISVVVDSYVTENLQYLKYVYYNNIYWKISRVKMEYPRLIITLDGDPFNLGQEILPDGDKEAEIYVNNFLTSMPKLNCKLVYSKKDQPDLEITFDPVSDPVLLYYIRYKKAIIRAQLLSQCTLGSIYRGLSLVSTSGQFLKKEKQAYLRTRLNQKSFYGISHIDFDESSLKKGKILLKNILSVRSQRTYSQHRRNQFDERPKCFAITEQNFSCELYTMCRVHNPDFNKNANILYWESAGFRRISDNTVAHQWILEK